MKIRYAVSLILVALLVGTAAVFCGSAVWTVVDLPSLVVVLGLASILSLGGFSFSEIRNFFKVAFRSGDVSGSEFETLKKAAVYFRALQGYLILSGILGTLLGTITMLAQYEDKSMLGQGVALALLTVFYAVILIATVALPLRAAAEKRIAEAEEQDRRYALNPVPTVYPETPCSDGTAELPITRMF